MKLNLEQAALVYLGVPLVLFLATHMAWGVVGAVVLAAVLGRLWKEAQQAEGVNLKELAGCAVVAAIFCTLAGVGAVVWQSGDYEKSNFIFEALVKNEWPVTFAFADGTKVGLVYYLGYYLVPAGLAKFLGNVDAWSWLWAVGGMTLGLAAVKKYFKLGWWAVLLFLFWGGWSVVGNLITQMVSSDIVIQYNWWAAPLRLVSFISTLVWSPQHWVVALMGVPLVLGAVAAGRLRVAWGVVALSIFWSPFVAVGLAVLLLAGAWRQWRAALGAWENYVILLCAVLPVVVYYASRLFADRAVGVASDGRMAWLYPLFYILEVGVWLPFIARQWWTRWELWGALVILAVAPLVAYGLYFDFSFRVGLVGQLVLAGIAISSQCEAKKLLSLFALVWLLGALPAAGEFLWLKTLAELPGLKQRNEPMEFFTRMDPVVKQYLGRAGALGKLPAKCQTQPEDWATAQVYREMQTAITVSTKAQAREVLAVLPHKDLVVTVAQAGVVSYEAKGLAELYLGGVTPRTVCVEAFVAVEQPTTIILGRRCVVDKNKMGKLEPPIARLADGTLQAMSKPTAPQAVNFEKCVSVQITPPGQMVAVQLPVGQGVTALDWASAKGEGFTLEQLAVKTAREGAGVLGL